MTYLKRCVVMDSKNKTKTTKKDDEELKAI